MDFDNTKNRTAGIQKKKKKRWILISFTLSPNQHNAIWANERASIFYYNKTLFLLLKLAIDWVYFFTETLRSNVQFGRKF